MRACVRACVRACLRACLLACVRACVRACVCVCFSPYERVQLIHRQCLFRFRLQRTHQDRCAILQLKPFDKRRPKDRWLVTTHDDNRIINVMITATPNGGRTRVITLCRCDFLISGLPLFIRPQLPVSNPLCQSFVLLLSVLLGHPSRPLSPKPFFLFLFQSISVRCSVCVLSLIHI